MKKMVNLYKKYEEIINYIIVGGMTTLVSLGTKWLLLFTILDPKKSFELQLSVIISWICAVAFAYITNRIIVFKSKNNNILKEIISFVGARILTLLIEMVFMWLTVTIMKLNTDLWVFILTVLSQFIILVLNYIFSKIFVFKKEKI